MSYIPCSANCRYQNDGLCALNHAAAAGACDAATGGASGCLHYVPRSSVLRGAQFHAAPPQDSIPAPASDL